MKYCYKRVEYVSCTHKSSMMLSNTFTCSPVGSVGAGNADGMISLPLIV